MLGAVARQTRTIHTRRDAFLKAACVFALFASACRFPATEVVVTLGTDAPTDQTLTITASVRGAAAGIDAGRAVGSWRRGGASPQITLPASFAVVPAGDRRTEAIVLDIEASLEANGAQPVRTFHRVARFTLTPRVSASLPIFLPVSCSNSSTGCTSVAPDACTVSIRCEDTGMTCGDRGECVTPDVTPVPIQPGTLVDGAAVFDVSGETTIDVSDASDATDVSDVPVGDPLPPRQLAPLSTLHASTPTPLLRWALAPGTDGATIELSQQPDFSTGVMRQDATGTSLRAPALSPGAWFWRLHGRTGTRTGTGTSATWELRVGHIAGSTDAAYGSDLDFDRDGRVDFVISAPGAASTGIVHAYSGPASLLVSTVALSNSEGGSRFGRAVANAGDLNGDGFADVIIGASNAGGGAGAVAIIVGASPWVAPLTLRTIPGTDGTSANFGESVAGLGDVNGDGYGDIALMSLGAVDEGVIYVYLGGASGPEATASLVLRGADGVLTALGETMAQHVDVNGDGYGDLVVGAPGAMLVPHVYVYLGGPSGLSATPSQRIDSPDSGSNQFAHVMASAGDLNGDGRSDIVVGADQWNTQTGRAYVYLGTPSGLATTPIATLSGPDGTGTYFASAVEGAGDLDGDGFDELAVGAMGFASNTGRVYVFRGAAIGVSAAPSWTLDGPDGAGGYFGSSLAGNFDVENDGHAELLVGAPYVGASANEGRAYLYTSNSSGLVTTSGRAVMSPDGAGGGFGVVVR